MPSSQLSDQRLKPSSQTVIRPLEYSSTDPAPEAFVALPTIRNTPQEDPWIGVNGMEALAPTTNAEKDQEKNLIHEVRRVEKHAKATIPTIALSAPALLPDHPKTPQPAAEANQSNTIARRFFDSVND
jgi:hypothetical protein